MEDALMALTTVDLLGPTQDPAVLDVLLQPRLSLFWGAETPTRALLAMLTVVAVRGREVRVFDGGNRFDGYFVARTARRLSSHPYAVLERIRLSRAFTCFQLAELIERSPASAAPLFVLDFLSTFYDESVPLRDTERLLVQTLAHLKRLAAGGPVIVGAREPRNLVKDRWVLLDRLQAAADIAWLSRPLAAESQAQLALL